MTFLCAATPPTTVVAASAAAAGYYSAQTQAFNTRRRNVSGGDRVLSAKRHTIIVAGRQQWHEHDEIAEGPETLSDGQDGAEFDPRAFRRALNKSPNYNRRVANDSDSIELMKEHGVGYSEEGLISQMRSNEGNAAVIGDVTFRLAEAYGFCWGVERAVQMAYEARRKYPENQLHITNEIIHNPSVNDRLKEMEINFVQVRDDGIKDFDGIQGGEVVILPAFGASVEEMKLLNDRGVKIVDTTCPWVAKVWNAVDTHTRKDFTSVIHGKYAHEETVATASFAGKYIIVKNIPETQMVIDYILHGGDKTKMEETFKNSVSEGFDFDKDLDRLGIANQTTMLKGETEAIGKMLEKCMMEKFGPEVLNEHFMVMDTICDATQERQDAMDNLVEMKDLDLILVVGGFNSSNTSHLQEIAELKGIPSYWVDQASRIRPESNEIDYKTSWGELRTQKSWLSAGPITVGVTSGASTPDKVVEDVMEALLQTKASLSAVAQTA